MKPIPTETATDVGSVGKWLGAAAAGALLMYLLDPERGAARRSRAVSAVRDAGARTGATVDHALHSAGNTLADLKDSAASALSRGAGQLQAQASPMLDRAQRGAKQAMERIEDSADRARDRFSSSASASNSGGSSAGRSSPTRYNTYESDRSYSSYDSSSRERGGLAGWLQGLTGGRTDMGAGMGASGSALMGGSMLGMLGLMRRSPTALLLGLAGLALIMRGAGKQRYTVGAFTPTMSNDERGEVPTIPPSTSQSGSSYLH